MLRIGLTGNIGAGKTTVTKLFEEKGAFVMEADSMVHRLLSPGTTVWEQVISKYGTKVLTSQGNEIDRGHIARLIFRGSEPLRSFLDIIYPPLKAELLNGMDKAASDNKRIFIFDASQLLEAGWEDAFQMIILVRARFDVCRKRLSDRSGFDLDQITLRSRYQWPDWVKMRYSDFIIDNNGPLWKTREIVNAIYNRLAAFE